MRWSILGAGLLACTGTIDPGVERPGGPPAAPTGGGSGSPAGEPAPPAGVPATGPMRACALPARRIVKLTREQYNRTVQALLPTVTDFANGLPSYGRGDNGFSNESGQPRLSLPDVEAHFQAATRLADALVARVATLDACLGTTAPDSACVGRALRALGKRAFRRPLFEAEVEELQRYHAQESAQRGAADGLRQTLRRMLLSPHFLFRTELGGVAVGGTVQLTPHEVASALSYTLLDGPPDAELWAAADRNELGTTAQVETQARRLLAKPDTASGLRKLLQELFATNAVVSVAKDDVFAGFDQDVAGAMKAEADRFFEHVLWKEDRRLTTLLTAPFSVLDDTLARFYRVSGWTSVGGGGSRVHRFEGQNRAGALSLGAVMTALASASDTDVVKRGHFVRSSMLCQETPPPPPGLNPILPAGDGKRTQRERLAQHSSDPGCATCHQLMDPLGLPFETFDGVGRHRTTDLGKPIETSGQIAGIAGQPRFAHAAELAALLAASPEANACLVRTFFRYGHARVDEGDDRCALQALATRFASAGGDLLDLALGVLSADEFTRRRAN